MATLKGALHNLVDVDLVAFPPEEHGLHGVTHGVPFRAFANRDFPEELLSNLKLCVARRFVRIDSPQRWLFVPLSHRLRVRSFAESVGCNQRTALQSRVEFLSRWCFFSKSRTEPKPQALMPAIAKTPARMI